MATAMMKFRIMIPPYVMAVLPREQTAKRTSLVTIELVVGPSLWLPLDFRVRVKPLSRIELRCFGARYFAQESAVGI